MKLCVSCQKKLTKNTDADNQPWCCECISLTTNYKVSCKNNCCKEIG